MKVYETIDISGGYTQALARSMTSTKEVIAKTIWDETFRKKLPIYKLHMHAKKDWRILHLHEVNGRSGYYTHSYYKSYKEAQAILKILEVGNG